MNFFTKFLMGQMLLMDEAGDGKGGGGGTPDPKDKEIADLKAKIIEFEKSKTPPEKKDDPTLEEKARLEREAAATKAGESKDLETALRFNMGSKDFIKNNASLLPPSVEGIFVQAEKENYGSAVEKARAIKVGIVSEYFAIAENLDQLTAHQKQSLEEFKKLTKTVKEERVQAIYDSIFEPTLEMSRKVKKAQALQKGMAEPSDAQDAYRNKLINGSRKYHLGEK